MDNPSYSEHSSLISDDVDMFDIEATYDQAKQAGSFAREMGSPNKENRSDERNVNVRARGAKRKYPSESSVPSSYQPDQPPIDLSFLYAVSAYDLSELSRIMKDDQERQLLYKSLDYVIARADELSKALQDEGVITNHILPQDCIECCRAIKMMFIDSRNYKPFATPDTRQCFAQNLDMVLKFILLLREFNRFPEECLLWLACALIDLRGRLPIEDVFGGVIVDHAYNLCRNLSGSTHECFLALAVQEIWSLYRGEKDHLCLNAGFPLTVTDFKSGDQFVVDAFAICIDETQPYESKTAIVQTIFFLLADKAFNYTGLSEPRAALACEVFLKTVTDSYLAYHSISFLHRFLNLKLMQDIHFVCFLDCMIAYLQLIYDSHGQEPVVEQDSILQSIFAALIQVNKVTEIGSDEKLFETLTFTSYLPFVRRLLPLVQYADAHNLAPTILVCRCLDYFREEVDWYAVDLVEPTTALMHNLVLRKKREGEIPELITSLFNFLAKLCGDCDAVGIVDSIVKEVDQMKLDSLYVRQVFIKGLTLIPAAAEFLGSIVPNEEHMLSIMEELKTSMEQYSERLTLAMSITSALCHHYKGSPDTLISFLSLPWICDIDWSTWEHFQKSFPLLVPIKLREDELRTMLSATDLQKCSIQAIARIPYKNEWRTHLFKHVFALPASPVVVAALKALHLFCASMPSFSFFDEIEPLMAEYSKKCLETKDAEVLDVGCALFNAVTNCLCIQSKDIEFKELEVKCAVCDGHKGKRQSVPIKIPVSFFDLCRTAVAVDSEEFEIKFGFNGALCAIFRHVKDAVDAKEELINISFDFLNCGEPVSTDYKGPVTEFVRGGMSTRIGCLLRDKILRLPDEESQIDYFCCIAEHSPDSLGKQCLADIIAMACVRTERNVKILNKARNVIIAIAVRDGIRPKTLFIRDAYLICRSIAQVLMAAVHNVSLAEEIDHDTVIPFIVEGCLCSLSSVFSLNLTNNPGDVLRAWLEIGINHIVPHFFLSSGEHAGAAEYILKHFVAILDITQKDLVKQSLPNIFFIIVGVRKRSWNNVLVKRIEQFSEVSFATLVRYEAFKVTATLVLCLGLSENTVMSHLSEVFKYTNEEAEFTMTDCVKPYYLGILLSIRRAFADDMYFNYREMICRSVARLITLLDNAFLTQSPSKMFAVLRAATPKCDAVVDAWIRLLEKIDTEVLKDIMHQVLFAVAPLSTVQGASRVFKILQEIRRDVDPNSNACLRFDRAVEVLDCPESPMLYLLPPCSVRSREDPLRSCAKMLIEETSDTYILVLPRMLTLIHEHVKYSLMREVMESLLSALKCNSCPDTMKLIALCLGRCGAIDPGRLGMSAYGDSSRPLNTTSTHLYFIDDRQQFFKDVLKTCVRCLLEYADAHNVDFISFAIQEVLKELRAHDQLEGIVLNALEPWIRFEVLPFRGTSFKPSLHEKLFENVKPLVSHSQTYDEWLSRWYYTASDRIRADNGRVFRTLQYIFFAGSARLAQDLISTVILQALVEGNAPVVNDAVLEIQTVFALAVTDEYDWIRMASHTCFKLIEYIEKYHYFRMDQDIDTSHRKIGARIEEFLATVLSTVKEGGITLLAVDVSNKYNSPCRALRWQEQYGFVHCNRGFPQFNRDAFYVLEKLYREVRDTDSVMGAYSCINKHTSVRLCEQTVAFEAIGNYTAALPLYEMEPLQAVPLVRCFLELNQPISAFSMVPLFLYNTTDDNERRELLDCQYEAAFRQGNWDFLADQLKRRDDSYVSWGSQIAAVLSSIQSRCEDDYDTRIERARFEAVTALQALTLEDIDTYTQCYNFVQRLHVLSEIDDAVNSLDLLDDVDVPVDELEKLVKRWDVRSENAIQSPSVLEPIYTTRTAILKMTTPPESSNYVCQYMLESSKLSRAAGHLSTAWTRIVEARGLEIEDDICIDIEESRYLSLNNQVGEAITLLQKSLAKNFPDLIQQMEAVNKKCRDSQTQIKFLDHLKLMKKDQLTTPVPRQDAFVNAQLQLTEFMEKAKANSHDIYQRYYFLDRFSMNNEHQLYKFALFFDNTFYLNNEANYDVNMFLICLYRRVLAAGKRYLLHVMPRMLTVWLDFANVNEHLDEEKQFMAKKRRNETPQKQPRINELTNLIMNAFQSLDHFYFFTAYPQLISRLCISSETVWVTLETMIIELIMEYPHECMWQTVSSLRADAKTQVVRQKKIKRLCQMLVKSKTEKTTMDFQKLINDYSTVAKELVDVCFAKDKSCLPGVHHNFNTQFHRLARFFANPQTKVSVPFITMVEKRLPTFNASQISMPNSSEPDDTVYITGFENDFHVYSSLEMPKRITMIASNGMRYPLIAKPKDELRKDASCEDLFRTINIFLLRDAEARRRQLHIRTYSVIPLQAMGGIIEFLPNLVSLRSPMGQKTDYEKNMEERWHAAPRGSRDRVRLCRNLIDKSNVKMAKWFRQTYPDPSKWYAARLAFTRTAATMSMVGFILGLGDRHCENILIDVTTGDCVHVDFNCIFNRTDFLPVPDYVPFRLTQNMRDAFGPNGVEGCFRIACETVLRILREEKSTMFSVLETFIHDPLLEFFKIDKRNLQLRNQKDDDKRNEVQLPGDIQAELALIRARLDGKVVGIRLNPLTKTSAALSVEGQVAQLIETAADIRSLEQMFIGWSPHY